MLGVLCTSSHFVRINSARRFPCALYLQSLELCSFLIGASCYGPEIWRQANSYNGAGGAAERAFNAVDRIINNMTTIIVFSYCKPNPCREIAKNNSKLIITLYIYVVEIWDPQTIKLFRHVGFFATQGWTLLKVFGSTCWNDGGRFGWMIHSEVASRWSALSEFGHVTI
jgi:hypothetical protein